MFDVYYFFFPVFMAQKAGICSSFALKISFPVSLACWFVLVTFCHCNKIPEQIILKDLGLILAHGFKGRLKSLVTWPHC
jgi:hypothetical protein